METINLSTEGNLQMVEITGKLNEIAGKSGVKNGVLLAFVDGSTGALVTLEDETGLVEDFREMLENVVPDREGYRHDRIDSNAVSHLRASLLGASVALPIENGKLVHGTWQQVFFVDLDKRPRKRTIRVQVVG